MYYYKKEAYYYFYHFRCLYTAFLQRVVNGFYPQPSYNSDVESLRES